MPGKPRRRKNKRPQSKKRSGLGSTTKLAQQPVVTQTHEPIARPIASVPSLNVRSSVTKPTAVQHSHIGTELRTIGIIAGIILIILIVLVLRLS